MSPCTSNSDCMTNICSSLVCLAGPLLDDPPHGSGNAGDLCSSNDFCQSNACAYEKNSLVTSSQICCADDKKYWNEDGRAYCGSIGPGAPGDSCIYNNYCTTNICSGQVCLSGPLPAGAECTIEDHHHCQSSVCAYDQSAIPRKLVCCRRYSFIADDGASYCSARGVILIGSGGSFR